MIELTKIDKPFGLLDPETQRALKAYEGDVEVYLSHGWVTSTAVWCSRLVYRAKPQPREWWLNVYEGATVCHASKAAADEFATTARLACVHVREVTDE